MEANLARIERHVIEGEARLAKQLALLQRFEHLGEAHLAARARIFLEDMQKYQRLLLMLRDAAIDLALSPPIAAGPTPFDIPAATLIPYAAEALGALDIARFALVSLKLDIGDSGAAGEAADIALEWLEVARRALNLEDDASGS